ncbi:MAG TPA: PDZ domain-containing protein, partial [Gammaproteobacteria bacterium]|nr:PDZ domain-containing protein [Gammaproteobacteria bacterium]
DPLALRNAIGLMRPGDRVEVDFIRDGQRRTVEAELGELDAPTVAAENLGETDPRFEGAELVTNDEQRPDYNGVPGVRVAAVEAGSPAAQRGLQPGDVITHVNRQRVRTLAEARQIIENSRSVVLQISRDDRSLLLLMP